MPIEITVDYGYDIHSIEISDEELKDIQLGKELKPKSKDFQLKEMENDWWKFNTLEQGSP